MAGGRTVKCVRCTWTKFRCFGGGVLVEPCPECGARVRFAECWAGEKPYQESATGAHSELEPVVLVDSAAFRASTGPGKGAEAKRLPKAASARQARWRAKKAGQQAPVLLTEAA
jgi:hypothetical protein